MPKRAGLLVAGFLLAGVLAACAPTFASGATLVATPLGPLAMLTWGAATADAGKSIASYRVEVDGAQVALVPGSATSCVLTGLAPSTSYLLRVTAYDSENAWSGDLGGDMEASGRVQATYVTGPAVGGGAVRNCVSPTDSDGDRLPNAVETNNGVFVSAASTGTNPGLADSDGDGLRDGDETLGTTAGLDLPTLGTKPVRKDLLFEFDWFDDSISCGVHSHRPTANAVNRLTSAFAAAPVVNLDSSTGVNVIADYGQGGAFTGGSLVPDADGVLSSGVNSTEFNTLKHAQFANQREGYFHYTVMPHNYNVNSTSSGQAEILGDDLIVSLQCAGSDRNVANTIMHEVGHNLNLRHGGNVDTPNYKPNYNSVMNYRYQFPGIDTDCDAAGDGVLAYSTGARASLNEASLLETNGVCNGVDIDWNGNAVIDAGPVAADINNLDGLFSILGDNNDWAAMNFGAINDADGAPVGEPEVITEQPVPLWAY
ncbi:MAG: fibronectin type III domain-containing protein [Aquihabitans sp.]